MNNSKINDQTKPLRTGDVIKEGDIFWTYEDEKIQWLEVGVNYYGVEYDPAKYAPMRRPIPQSVDFIREGVCLAG